MVVGIHQEEFRLRLGEKNFRNVCSGKIKDQDQNKDPKIEVRRPKCHFVHHFDPFLKLGPFHIDIKFYLPFRTIIHDFFTDKEMDWIMEYSRPRLTTTRSNAITEFTKDSTKTQRRYGDKKDGYTTAKTVTYDFADIIYNETEVFQKISRKNEPLMYKAIPLKDPNSFTIVLGIMLDISKRIELATHLNVTDRHASSHYQTTNYGLGGLVETHSDPYGYEMGTNLVEGRDNLVVTGDYIATFMGWLNNVSAGGATAFCSQTKFDGILEATKGSAAFWISLSSCHVTDQRAIHGGCPVLKGSKWILNKWIYSWDQWKDWPCELQPTRTISPFRGMST